MKITKLDKGRNDFAKLLNGMIGVEIGVEKGNFSAVLSDYANWLYCIDPWQYSTEYRSHVDQVRLDSFYEATKEKLKDKRVTILRGFSVPLAEDFDDSSLDFVYVDGAHDFENVYGDLMAWYSKLRPGGIMAGHDFTGSHKDVKKAVLQFCVRNRTPELFEWCGDRSHSFHFVKPIFTEKDKEDLDLLMQFIV